MTVQTGFLIDKPDLAKAHAAAAAMGVSLGEYYRTLVKRDEVDPETGCPTWFESPPALLASDTGSGEAA